MNALLNYFVDLCLLRSTPQDLPASSALFGLTALANLLVGALLVVGETFGPLMALAESLTEIALLLLALFLALRWQNRLERLAQVATAILGSGALMGLVALPLVGLGSSDSGAAALGGFLLLGLVVWSVVVLGHILRHAFDLTLSQGVIVGLFYTLISFQLIASVFPVS